MTDQSKDTVESQLSRALSEFANHFVSYVPEEKCFRFTCDADVYKASNKIVDLAPKGEFEIKKTTETGEGANVPVLTYTYNESQLVEKIILKKRAVNHEGSANESLANGIHHFETENECSIYFLQAPEQVLELVNSAVEKQRSAKQFISSKGGENLGRYS
jgi:hypothetical protein